MNDSISIADVLLVDDMDNENREKALDGANLKDPQTGIATCPVTRNHKVKQVSMAVGKLADSQEAAGAKLAAVIDKLGDAIGSQSAHNKTYDDLEK
jgi:hypothetical protein